MSYSSTLAVGDPYIHAPLEQLAAFYAQAKRRLDVLPAGALNLPGGGNPLNEPVAGVDAVKFYAQLQRLVRRMGQWFARTDRSGGITGFDGAAYVEAWADTSRTPLAMQGKLFPPNDWTRKWPREISTLAASGTNGQLARFVRYIGVTPGSDAPATGDLVERVAGAWIAYTGTRTYPDILEGKGEMQAGDIVGAWIPNELRDAMRLLTSTVQTWYLNGTDDVEVRETAGAYWYYDYAAGANASVEHYYGQADTSWADAESAYYSYSPPPPDSATPSRWALMAASDTPPDFNRYALRTVRGFVRANFPASNVIPRSVVAMVKADAAPPAASIFPTVSTFDANEDGVRFNQWSEMHHEPAAGEHYVSPALAGASPGTHPSGIRESTSSPLYANGYQWASACAIVKWDFEYDLSA